MSEVDPVAVAGFDPVTSDELAAAFENMDHSEQVKVCAQSGVGLYHHDDQVPDLSEGTVTLTSKAIFFAGARVSRPHVCVYLKLLLASVVRVQKVRGVVMFSRPKIVVTLGQGHTKLSFRHGGIDTFYEHLAVMLDKKHWLAAVQRPVVVAPPPPDRLRSATQVHDDPFGSPTPVPAHSAAADATVTDRAGIRGIVDRREAQEERAVANLRTATSDIDDLISNAVRVKSLIANLKANSAKASQADRTALDELEARLGVFAPVTKATTSNWIPDLAAELRGWLLKHPTLRTQPSISFVELYAQFNRARGSGNCATPDDFSAACDALCCAQTQQKGTPANPANWVVATRPQDGVKVLQQMHVRAAAAAIVATLLDSKRSVSRTAFTAVVRPVELARELRISVMEGAELLDELCVAGTLSRCYSGPGTATAGFVASPHHSRYDYFWNPFVA